MFHSIFKLHSFLQRKDLWIHVFVCLCMHQQDKVWVIHLVWRIQAYQLCTLWYFVSSSCLTCSFWNMAPKQIYGYVQHLHSLMPNTVLWELCENLHVQLDSWRTILSIHISLFAWIYSNLSLPVSWSCKCLICKRFSHKNSPFVWHFFFTLTICTAHCSIQDLTTLIAEVFPWQSSLHCGLLWNVELQYYDWLR